MNKVPVITIDGPSGAGKGTVAQMLAERLGFHLLDSGAVYRAAGLHALRAGADLDDETSVMASLKCMDAAFSPHPNGVRVRLGNKDVTPELRSEKTAAAASKVAVMSSVRSALLEQQRSFRVSPGLVADGRDMGTAVFPEADLKIFLTASVAVRGNRRAKQLKEKGMQVNIESLLQEIAARDERDSSREHSPLVAAPDAIVIDSSDMTATGVVEKILSVAPGVLCENLS